MAAPALERFFASIFCGLGDISGQEESAVELMKEVSDLANHVYKLPIELAAEGSTNVNLSNIFEGVCLVAVIDVTVDSTGELEVGGNTDKVKLAANGFSVQYLEISETPPTVYLAAPSGQAKHVELIAIGKRA